MKAVLGLTASLLILHNLSFQDQARTLSSPEISKNNITILEDDAKQILVRKPPTERKGDINEALRNYGTQPFRAGSVRFLLDRDDMRHILLRHHPRFRRDKKKYQTDLDPDMEVDDIVKSIRKIVSDNRDILSRVGEKDQCQVTGRRGLFDRTIYVVGIQSGRHIRQFFPLHRDNPIQEKLCSNLVSETR